jgi:hypothetical protein
VTISADLQQAVDAAPDTEGESAAPGAKPRRSVGPRKSAN